MIRINLLAVERGPVEEEGRPGVTAAQRVTIGAALILLSTIVASAGGTGRCTPRGGSARRGDRRGRDRGQQLRSVLAQVQKFETRKAPLQQRVTLIEQLRRGQSGAGARARRNQQGAARSAVAGLDGPARRGLHDGRAHDVAHRRSPTSSPTCEASQLVQAAGRDPRQPGRSDAAAGDMVRFTIRGNDGEPRGAAAAPAGPAGRGAPPTRGSAGHCASIGQAAVDISLSKLPWYGQIGAFVVVCGRAIYGFWNFYVTDSEAELALKQTHLTALNTDINKGVATARRLPRVPGAGDRPRAPPREPAATSCPSRRTSPTRCAGCRGWPRSRT